MHDSYEEEDTCMRAPIEVMETARYDGRAEMIPLEGVKRYR